jgi:hypothetical protein
MPEADEYTLRALQENLSLMAVDSITNKLLGVAINGVVTKDTLSLPQDEDFVRQALNLKVRGKLGVGFIREPMIPVITHRYPLPIMLRNIQLTLVQRLLMYELLNYSTVDVQLFVEDIST